MLFSPITWLNIRLSAPKVTKSKYVNWGQWFQKCGLCQKGALIMTDHHNWGCKNAGHEIAKHEKYLLFLFLSIPVILAVLF